jgi:predicted flap endonuclease-1-like 5' DNA nuclease
MSPFEIVSILIQLLVILFGAAAIGYFIGRHCRTCRNCSCANAHDLAHGHADAMPSKKPLLEAATMAVPVAVMSAPSLKDDLKIVEGIGPAIEKLLNAEGIKSFAQLTQTPIMRLEAILKAGGPIFASHNPASWPTQAALARDGKWSELEALKTELVGGLSVK